MRLPVQASNGRRANSFSVGEEPVSSIDASALKIGSAIDFQQNQIVVTPWPGTECYVVWYCCRWSWQFPGLCNQYCPLYVFCQSGFTN